MLLSINRPFQSSVWDNTVYMTFLPSMCLVAIYMHIISETTHNYGNYGYEDKVPVKENNYIEPQHLHL